jgi:hypothetical protein
MCDDAEIPYLIHSMISIERGAKLRKRLCPDKIILFFFVADIVVFVSPALLPVAVTMGGLPPFPGYFALFFRIHGSEAPVRSISKGRGLAPLTGDLPLFPGIHGSKTPSLPFTLIALVILTCHMKRFELLSG